jgi:hypothetical protein
VDIPIGALHLSLVEAATRQTDAAIKALEAGKFELALLEA